MADDSYSLAEEFVRAALRRAAVDEPLAVGDEIDVPVSDVDCVPLSVDCDRDAWRLVGVRLSIRRPIATFRLHIRNY